MPYIFLHKYFVTVFNQPQRFGLFLERLYDQGACCSLKISVIT